MTRAGLPSVTAERVAAYRLGFERLPAPFGDPDADDRLTRNVAGSLSRELDLRQDAAMTRYLRGRTQFVDAAVCHTLHAGIRQVVTIGAGYDGRSLRYAKAGVRWFELDQDQTQQDKRRRLDRLDIACPDVRFAPVELERVTLAVALHESGHNADAASLFLCEGVAVYLTVHDLEVMLGEVRSRAAPGSRLVVTLSVSLQSPGQRAEREQLRRSVAAAGEPMRNNLTAAQATDMFTRTGWEATEASASVRHAGFVVAVPV